MSERQRQHGTFETLSETSAERLKAIRRVVTDKQYAKIDGEVADLWTCSVILQVYNSLKESNRAKYSNLPYRRMAVVAFKLTN